MTFFQKATENDARVMDSSSESSSNKEEFDALIQGCREGRPLMVAASLVEMTEQQRREVLAMQFNDDHDQRYSLFLLAVRRGHLQIVKLFLTMFSISPNEKCHFGNLTFDDYMVEGATPLWCAAAMSNFDIVNLLLDHDADVNQCTKTNSSPLRAAAFCGDLQIVRFLIDKGANIETPNIHLNTCLMVASYRGNLEVVQHLLSKGADPNVQDSTGCTALHFAVEGSQLGIVKELVHGGCDVFITNDNGLTALLCAADASHSDMVDFFCNLSCVSPLQRITLLELLATTFVNDKAKYDSGKTYHYFYLAILLRETGELPKAVLPPVKAYLNKKECETPEEVIKMKGDLDALHMESLVVRERILGSDNVEIPHAIIYRGAVYADGLQFSRGIDLWQRALELKQRNNREAVSDIYRFAEVFSQMVTLREEIEIDALVKVLECGLLETSRRKGELADVKDYEDCQLISIATRHHKCPHQKISRAEAVDILERVLEGTIHAMLYLILVVTKCAKTKVDLFNCRRVIYQFVKLDFRDRNGHTPLHMVLDEATPVDDFHVKDVCSFPNSDMCRLLLSCGADPNAICNDGNTPLHLIVQYAKPISDFVTLHQAITDLLEAGAHPDTRNYARKSPLDLATTGVSEIILKKESSWSLQCFAARVIRKHDIPYGGKVPVSLEKFIGQH